MELVHGGDDPEGVRLAGQPPDGKGEPGELLAVVFVGGPYPSGPVYLRYDAGGEPPVWPRGLSALHRLGTGGHDYRELIIKRAQLAVHRQAASCEGQQAVELVHGGDDPESVRLAGQPPKQTQKTGRADGSQFRPNRLCLGRKTKYPRNEGGFFGFVAKITVLYSSLI